MALENKWDLATQDLALYKAKKIDEDLKLNLSVQDLFRLYNILDNQIRESRPSIFHEQVSFDEFINQAIEKKEADESRISNEFLDQFLDRS